MSCSCCYHGYGLFTAVTLAWFAMNRNGKSILNIPSEHLFEPGPTHRAPRGNDSGIRPIQTGAFPDGSVRLPGSITSQTGLTDHVWLVGVDCGYFFPQNIDEAMTFIEGQRPTQV